jgi:hypothetical protein
MHQHFGFDYYSKSCHDNEKTNAILKNRSWNLELAVWHLLEVFSREQMIFTDIWQKKGLCDKK